MWNVRAARLCGLVACLAVALVLFGVSQLDAKKPPKPPEVQWQVAIPDMTEASNQGWNLYVADKFASVNEGFVALQNSETVEVDVFTNRDPETGEYYTVFTLTIAESESIGFLNLDFQGCRSYCLDGGEGPCKCKVFPESDGIDCCGVNCCSRLDESCEATGFIPMETFMEGSLHPTAGYDHFSLRFIVYTDIDSLDEVDGSLEGDAYLWRLNLWNTDEIMVDGDEFNHNIVCAHWIPLEDVVVERSGDEWTVTVDQCGLTGDGCPASDHGYSGRWVAFWETYYQGIWKEKGKSGNFSLDSEYRRAMGSAMPFKFITKWTRY